MNKFLTLLSLAVLFTVSLAVSIRKSDMASLGCDCNDDGECCDVEASPKLSCPCAQRKLLSEQQMMAKFRDLYNHDAELTHTAHFMEDDTQLCFRDDPRMKELSSKIDRNELNQDI